MTGSDPMWLGRVQYTAHLLREKGVTWPLIARGNCLIHPGLVGPRTIAATNDDQREDQPA
jgi:hypothetical protein